MASSTAKRGATRRAADARDRSVPDGAGQLGHERRDRHRGRGRRDDRERDPGRDHRLHARDGGADDPGRQGRRADRAQAGVLGRLRDLRRRLADDRAGPQLPHAADRLVVPRGRRRGADPARDRGAGGEQLRPRAAPRRLRADRGRRGDRDRRRAADRRARHDVLLVAVGVRRRGRPGARDPRCSAGGSPTRCPSARRALDLVGAVLVASGLGAVRLRRPAQRRVGLRRAEGGRAVVVRRLPGAVAASAAGCS